MSGLKIYSKLGYAPLPIPRGNFPRKSLNVVNAVLFLMNELSEFVIAYDRGSTNLKVLTISSSGEVIARRKE